jgi:dolichyl-phosphate-mannose--protein O-mannosyl transferase
MVCNECHYGYHSGGSKSLTLGQILQAKEDEDGEVDIPFLASLMGRVGLREDKKPLPDWAIQEREINAKR